MNINTIKFSKKTISTIITSILILSPFCGSIAESATYPTQTDRHQLSLSESVPTTPPEPVINEESYNKAQSM
jgi:hypothetical protein